MNRIKRLNLFRPSGLFLPAAFLAASMLGRGTAALCLFICLYAVKLCSLCAADSLPAAFASQPSVKYVQGSAVAALVAQLPGAILTALIFRLFSVTRPLLPLIPCGMLLNIEHVFYNYLFAVGDSKSACFSRCITAVMALLGMLLCSPREYGLLNPSNIEAIWPLITSGLAALIGLFLSMTLGGKLRPVLNAEVFRRAPLSMLQTALCPALTIAALAALWPSDFHPAPVFAGWALYEACRTPFRRTALESKFMNRLLCAVGIIASICCAASLLWNDKPLSDYISMTCAALLIAALCAFLMFGSIPSRSQ